jgi:hypothetical protein
VPNGRGYVYQDFQFPAYLKYKQKQIYTFRPSQKPVKHWSFPAENMVYNRFDVRAMPYFQRVHILLDNSYLGGHVTQEENGKSIYKFLNWSDQLKTAKAVRDLAIVLLANCVWLEPEWGIELLDFAPQDWRKNHPMEWEQMLLAFNWQRMTLRQRAVAIKEITMYRTKASGKDEEGLFTGEVPSLSYKGWGQAPRPGYGLKSVW